MPSIFSGSGHVMSDILARQPNSGILMTNDIVDINPEECVPCLLFFEFCEHFRLFSCGTSKEGESFLVEWNESEGAVKRT
ncbi:hypothetical protein ACHQM5_005601 [Ranunculus cassubicifolius]